MINRAARSPMYLLFLAAGWLAIAVPAAIGQAGTPPPSPATAGASTPAEPLKFEMSTVTEDKAPVATYRFAFTPEGMRIQNAPLQTIIQAAYGMFGTPDDAFPGMPDWAKKTRYDIEARVDEGSRAAFQRLNLAQRQAMIQAFLADRFKLQAHRETRELPVYTLTVAKTGSKLHPIEDPNATPTMEATPGQITAFGVLLSQIIPGLTQNAGHTVLDQTGLTGKYEFTLTWTPTDPSSPMPASPDSKTSIFTAVQEQLGLTLQPAKGKVDCLVIDHVEQPSGI
jgi:uncharacterized protein (TIGR03435 family)